MIVLNANLNAGKNTEENEILPNQHNSGDKLNIIFNG